MDYEGKKNLSGQTFLTSGLWPISAATNMGTGIKLEDLSTIRMILRSHRMYC